MTPKKILILVVSSQLPPYGEMVKTSNETWNSISVDGVETVFYFSEPLKENTDTEIYFPLKECYETMGHKMLSAFEWSLANRDFDYIVRVNSSCYVDKKELIKYVQTLPDTDLFSGGIVTDKDGNQDFVWGGLQFILSKDVVRKVVDNKDKWQHDKMEDVSVSYLVKDLGIKFTDGKGCSINKQDNGWLCICYGSDNYEFNDFSEIRKNGQFFYRVKTDGHRWIDKIIMQELFKQLQ